VIGVQWVKHHPVAILLIWRVNVSIVWPGSTVLEIMLVTVEIALLAKCRPLAQTQKKIAKKAAVEHILMGVRRYFVQEDITHLQGRLRALRAIFHSIPATPAPVNARNV
tara:strand:+ start:240 stop:566 length:327 start_codon:yes stop_codon:yes gene_type:complete